MAEPSQAFLGSDQTDIFTRFLKQQRESSESGLGGTALLLVIFLGLTCVCSCVLCRHQLFDIVETLSGIFGSCSSGNGAFPGISDT